MTLLGPILTSARTAEPLRGFGVVKVVPAWGMADGWTPARIAEVARLPETLIVRTSWGDPSAYAGTPRGRPYPVADRVIEELRPWLAARPDAVIEIGNEPYLPAHPAVSPVEYARHLDTAIRACRAVFPRARILPPAHSVHDPARDGAAGQWLAACAPAYRLCDGLTAHAYTADQLRRALGLLRTHVGAAPVWITELNLNERLDPAERARRLRAMAREAHAAAALIYHVDELGGADPAHFQPTYRLGPAELAALRQAADAPPPQEPPPMSDPDLIRHGATRLDGFLMDVLQFRTVEALRRHLRRHAYAHTAPWARGVTMHHTVSPTAAQWRGAASVLAMARYYRDTNKWDRGPHLFTVAGCPDASHAGIWQMTPLNLRGIHAAAFNTNHWGIEVCGLYDAAPWPADAAALALGAAAALADWGGLPSASVNGHRDDPGTTKTCPGRAVDLAAVRRGVMALRRGAA